MRCISGIDEGDTFNTNSVLWSAGFCMDWEQNILSSDFTTLVADIQRLRSAAEASVVVPETRRRTLGDRAFPVAVARAWNALPPTVTSAPYFSSFRRLLRHSFSVVNTASDSVP